MTNTTLHQAAQQALDALRMAQVELSGNLYAGVRSSRVQSAITALSAAIAAPQPEPVPEPYLCIKPACGADCNICNQALSPQEVRNYAIGYAILRNAPIDAIKNGGVFAGRTPDNVVINGADLDAATFGAAAQQSIDQQVESINAVFEAWRNGEDASMTLALAAPPAAPAPAVPEVMAGPMPPMSEADEKRLNAALTIVFDLACGPADPTMMQDELVAAAPVVREPLTDEQIDALWSSPMSADWEHREFARAIEAHHGIGGGGNG